MNQLKGFPFVKFISVDFHFSIKGDLKMEDKRDGCVLKGRSEKKYKKKDRNEGRKEEWKR